MNPLEQKLNPFPWYQTMRQSMPVHFDEQSHMWSVFRYDDVERVLSDYAVFSSRFGMMDAEPDHPLAASLISSDPPRHRQLRTLVSQAFTPKAIAQLEPKIVAITRELLDRVAGTGQMDVIDDLGYPLPVIVIAEMLGIPPEDRDRFRHWSDAIVTSANMTPTGQPDTGGEMEREMAEYFLRMIEIHRRQPGDDLISALLAAEVDGQRLSQMDLLGFCILLLVAGNETTKNLIGNAILCFDEHPDTMMQLKAQPELLPDAIEEVLRYRSPVQSMFRMVLNDTVLDGQELRAGQRMLAWIGSANHDEAEFPDPERFDIQRRAARHLAFGHGIHFCLGAPLARLEARVVLSAILSRMPDIKVVPGAQLEPEESIIVYGLKHLPVTFSPA